MKFPRRFVLLLVAAAAASAGPAAAQLPDWTSVAVNPGATGAVEASLVYSVDGNTVSLYSALTRSWTTVTSTTGAPVVKIYNDHVVVRDGTTFYGYSPRGGGAVALATTAGALISASAQTWYSIVVDGTQAYAYLAYFGTWFAIPTAGPITTSIGRWCGLVADGTNVWGVSAYHAAAVPLGVPGATVIPTGYGYQCLAESPGFIHAFSASRGTWSSIAVSPARTIGSSTTQGSFVYVRDGSSIHFFSGAKGAFTTVTAPPSAVVSSSSRTVAVVRDGTLVTAYSSLTTSTSSAVLPVVPTIIVRDYFAMFTDGVDLLPYSSVRGTFGAVLPDATPGAQASMNLMVAYDATSGQPTHVYSGFRNVWEAMPSLTGGLQNLWVNSLMVVVQDGTGFYARSAHGLAWVHHAAPAPELVFNRSGDWLARTGTTLLSFNPNTASFSSVTTNAPVTQVNMHDNTHVAIDGDGSAAYAFSHFTNRWASVQLNGPVTQYGADKQAAFVNDGLSIHAFGGVGQTSNVNEYPDWVRVMPLGSPFLGHVTGEIGSLAYLFASFALNPFPSPWGMVWLDLNSLFLLDLGTIPANGVRVISVLVPDAPWVSGNTVYFQTAVEGGPSGLYLTEFAQTTLL